MVGAAVVGTAVVGTAVVGDALVGTAVVGEFVVGACVGVSVSQQLHSRLLLDPEGTVQHWGLRLPSSTWHTPSVSAASVNPIIFGTLALVPAA